MEESEWKVVQHGYKNPVVHLRITVVTSDFSVDDFLLKCIFFGNRTYPAVKVSLRM
jgi:hypothetical protein